MLALAWERDRERRKLEKAADDLEQRLTTEVRRRFASVRIELRKNAESLDVLAQGITAYTHQVPTFDALHPQLLEGAWSENAPRLSELVADYDLIAKLATTYGRIEELRWRIRYRTEHQTKILDGMTEPLIAELRDKVAELVQGVGDQVDKPDVQPLGLRHTSGFAATVGVTATMETKVIRANEGAKGD